MEIGEIGNKLTKINNMANLTIKSRFYTNYEFKIHAAVLQNITCQLPQTAIDTKKINIPNSKVDILLGADIYYDLLKPDIKKLGSGLPTLLNTKLGWVVASTAPIRNTFNIIC